MSMLNQWFKCRVLYGSRGQCFQQLAVCVLYVDRRSSLYDKSETKTAFLRTPFHTGNEILYSNTTGLKWKVTKIFSKENNNSITIFRSEPDNQRTRIVCDVVLVAWRHVWPDERQHDVAARHCGSNGNMHLVCWLVGDQLCIKSNVNLLFLSALSLVWITLDLEPCIG